MEKVIFEGFGTHCIVWDRPLNKTPTLTRRHPQRTRWRKRPTTDYHCPVTETTRINDC